MASSAKEGASTRHAGGADTSISVEQSFADAPPNQPSFEDRNGHTAPFLFSTTEGEDSSELTFSPPVLPSDWASERATRYFDLIIGLALLVLVLPLLGVCAVAVLSSGPGPLLYRQDRIGRRGQTFACLKFRTMSHGAEHQISSYLQESALLREEWNSLHKLRNDPRVTPIGRIMRRYSLDELPQLFNVLAGDMSVVGPRPIVAAEVRKFGESFGEYCSVKPGLTGLWQISGRHALSYEERVRIDVEYTRSKSVRRDLMILVKTIPIVLQGQNG